MPEEKEGKNRGYAVVQFENPQEAYTAIREPFVWGGRREGTRWGAPSLPLSVPSSLPLPPSLSPSLPPLAPDAWYVWLEVEATHVRLSSHVGLFHGQMLSDRPMVVRMVSWGEGRGKGRLHFIASKYHSVLLNTPSPLLNPTHIFNIPSLLPSPGQPLPRAA